MCSNLSPCEYDSFSIETTEPHYQLFNKCVKDHLSHKSMVSLLWAGIHMFHVKHGLEAGAVGVEQFKRNVQRLVDTWKGQDPELGPALEQFPLESLIDEIVDEAKLDYNFDDE